MLIAEQNARLFLFIIMKDRKLRRFLRKNYDWDYMFFYKIQLYKLEQMYKYFKQNKYIDCSIICRDINICINLLNRFINGEIAKYINIRNYKRFNIDKWTQESLFKTEDYFKYRTFKNETISVKINPSLYAKEELYRDKLLHLYNLIIYYKSQSWTD